MKLIAMTLVLAATLVTQIAQAQDRTVASRNRQDLQNIVESVQTDEERQAEENERYRIPRALRESGSDPNMSIGLDSSREVGDVRVRPFYSSRWKDHLLPNERRELEDFGSCVSHFCAHRDQFPKVPGITVRVRN